MRNQLGEGAAGMSSREAELRWLYADNYEQIVRDGLISAEPNSEARVPREFKSRWDDTVQGADNMKSEK